METMHKDIYLYDEIGQECPRMKPYPTNATRHPHPNTYTATCMYVDILLTLQGGYKYHYWYRASS